MRKKQLSGGKRLMLAGKRCMNLGILPQDHDVIKRAADAERLPMTAFVLRSALSAANKVLAKQPAPTA